MQRFNLIILLFLWISIGQAQSVIGFNVGASNTDTHLETFWYQYQLSPKFSIGLQAKVGEYRYRFINARQVENDLVYFVGLPLGFRLMNRSDIRLDFNLTTSWRFINSNTYENGLESSSAIEIDPNLIASFRTGEKTLFHAGIMMRTVIQTSPESLGEQTPSAILLNGFSYQLGARSMISLRTYVGPMSGAGGDTAKFFWKASLGLQWTLGKKASNNQITFFNF